MSKPTQPPAGCRKRCAVRSRLGNATSCGLTRTARPFAMSKSPAALASPLTSSPSIRRHRRPDPGRRPAGLELAATDLDGGDEPARPHGGPVPRRHLGRRGDPRQGGTGEAARVPGLQEPHPRQDSGAAAVRERRLDEFDGPAAPDHPDLGVDDVDRDRAQDVERQPPDHQPVPATGVAVALDGVDEQAERGRDVLLVGGPRPAHVRGRAEGRGTDPLEVPHLGQGASRSRTSSSRARSAPPRSANARCAATYSALPSGVSMRTGRYPSAPRSYGRGPHVELADVAGELERVQHQVGRHRGHQLVGPLVQIHRRVQAAGLLERDGVRPGRPERVPRSGGGGEEAVRVEVRAADAMRLDHRVRAGGARAAAARRRAGRRPGPAGTPWPTRAARSSRAARAGTRWPRAGRGRARASRRAGRRRPGRRP